MTLSRLIPCALIGWCLLGVAARFLPLQWLHILPEHIATTQPTRYQPFRPNLRLVEDPWIGETAVKGNQAPQESRGLVRFSTDALGYRWTPNLAAGEPVDLLLYGGASFAYGGGLSDDETFASVMTRSGIRTYNGGRFFRDPQDLPPLDWLLERLPRRGERLQLVFLEWEQARHRRSHLDGLPWVVDGPGRRLLGEARYQQARAEVQYARRRWDAWWSLSPLDILSIRFYKSLCNDRILPNSYASLVHTHFTPAGERMLLLEEEVQVASQGVTEAELRQNADFFAYYASLLAQRKIDLSVILLPNRCTLYGPYLRERPIRERSPYLERLESALRQRGIPVLNGLRVLAPDAEAELISRQPSYYREDHHWTARGVEKIAAAYRKLLRSGHVIQ